MTVEGMVHSFGFLQKGDKTTELHRINGEKGGNEKGGKKLKIDDPS